MTPLPRSAVRHVHLGILWSASLLVPTSMRSDWSKEWRSELWYVLREISHNPGFIRKATTFCMGAYQDAIWLRKQTWRQKSPFARICGSPAFCILLLIGTFLATWGIAATSPRVAAEMSRIQVQPWRAEPQHLTPCDCASDMPAEEISMRARQLFFDGFTHYSIIREGVRASAVPQSEWTVAHAKPDFFTVLQLPMRPMRSAGIAQGSLPQIVLSQEIWRREFGARSDIAGAILHVGSIDAVVAGVAFGATLGLPGNANAWLLDSDPPTGSKNAEFVVRHLTPVGYFQLTPRWALSLFGIVLAFLAMPCITSLSIGDCVSGPHKLSFSRRSLFGGFMTAKIAVLLGIVYFASIDLGCALVQPLSHLAGCIQFASSLALCHLGLGWVFRDQRQRCPVCLSRMACPVKVGQLSRTFLEWNGTELVCESGHTLLHIPQTPTSWFGIQRWVCLDGSWQFLFARPNERSNL